MKLRSSRLVSQAEPYSPEIETEGEEETESEKERDASPPRKKKKPIPKLQSSKSTSRRKRSSVKRLGPLTSRLDAAIEQNKVTAAAVRNDESVRTLE